MCILSHVLLFVCSILFKDNLAMLPRLWCHWTHNLPSSVSRTNGTRGVDTIQLTFDHLWSGHLFFSLASLWLFLFILGLINRDRYTFSFIKLSYTFLFLLNPFLVLGSWGVGLVETETMPCGAYFLQETSCSQEWSGQWRVERGVKIREEKARHDGTCL